MCRGLRSAPCGLGNFIRESLTLNSACTVEEGDHRSLWPVPPVRWRWTAPRSLNPKRRRRHRLLRACHELLNIVLCCLNWETLGFPAHTLSHAQLGAPISSAQHGIIERITDSLMHYLHMEDFTGDFLARAKEKFSGIIQNIQELPWCKSRLEDLTQLAEHVHSGLDPYGNNLSSYQGRTEQNDEAQSHQCEFDFCQSSVRNPNPTSALPVVSDRVKWNCPPSFAASEFLEDPLLKAAYENPEVMRKPPDLWEKKRIAKVHCSRREFLKLARRWDDLHACCLIDANLKNMDEAVGLFCVPKDSENDRLIVNPQVINGRMFSLASATKELAPGCLLSMLHLKPDDMFRFNADDLSDYYYTFRVSHDRAIRNAFRIVVRSDEVRDFKCYNPSLEGKPILICLKTLAMGDNLAVEVAQAAHASVLRTLCGSMKHDEVLKYRWPVPRTDFIELLAIDDHVGIQRVPRCIFDSQPRLRDTEVFEEATQAYQKVGLVLHEKKKKRNMTQGVILGADFDGLAGRVMAPRQRILVLSMISIAIAHRGTCTPKLLQIVLGCWIHVLLFRRALFALIDDLFKQGRGLASHAVFCLSNQARNELVLLAALGPTAQSDLRVSNATSIYATDASPTWGAVCKAPVSEHVTAELWRHSEQKGYYTRLQNPAAAVLNELDMPCESDEQFAHEPYNCSPVPPPQYVPKPLSEGILYDCCEIFRGSGNWSTVHTSRGLTCHDGFDIDGRRLRCGDLSSHAVFRELTSLAARRVVREWHAGVPCVSFGTLRRPQVRSIEVPYGFNPSDPFTAYHNMLARRCAMILTIAVMMGQFISVEQPRNSRLFLLHCFQTLVRLGCVVSHFAFCRFGSAFQKASKWLHNKPWLLKFEGACQCPREHEHFVIRGVFTKDRLVQFKSMCQPSCLEVYGHEPTLGSSVASFSSAYPMRLVHGMASGSLAARQGSCDQIPVSKKLQSLQEVGLVDEDLSIPVSTEASFPLRSWYENPEWHSELCEFLNFREMFRYKFRRPGHINVNELRTYKSWLKAVAKSHPDSRFVGLLDSRVTIGATTKGRSSSYALSRVLKGCIAYIIGGGLYPGLLHIYSKENRADDPTRYRSVRPPSRPTPSWFEALSRGDPSGFDRVAASAKFEKNPARWLRFLLMVCGDIEPNPGPYRGPLDLRIGFAAATADRMSKCLESFQKWCESELKIPWATLRSDSEAVVYGLRAYGLFCFETGLPRYQFVYAITAVQDQLPQCRPLMTMAWQIDKKWQIYEPGMCRSVLPPSVIKAAVCLAVLWQWPCWAALVLLGFAAMLHPSEIMALHRGDLIFPSDISFDTGSLYVRVRDPKTARFARRQHGRIDDPEIIFFAESMFGKLLPGSKLYTGSMTLFRKQWNSVMQRLGVPHTQAENGATPGVLRGSGATFFYQQTEDLAWVAWRGRWSRTRTLEYYLQEVGAFVLIHNLDSVSKTRISILSQFAWPVLHSFLDLRCSTGGVG